MKRYLLTISLLATVLGACNLFEVRKDEEGTGSVDSLSVTDSLQALYSQPADNTRSADTALLPPAQVINTGPTRPEEVVAYAEGLIGIPYVYGSTNPKKGFDCSGFITHVFNHFKIAVPRSSVDFTDVGTPVPVEQARRGDLILFTGTNPREQHVGHMGLVTANNDSGLQFIHSSSGKAMGVVVTPLNDYYKTRFVKVIRIFPESRP